MANNQRSLTNNHILFITIILLILFQTAHILSLHLFFIDSVEDQSVFNTFSYRTCIFSLCSHYTFTLVFSLVSFLFCICFFHLLLILPPKCSVSHSESLISHVLPLFLSIFQHNQIDKAFRFIICLCAIDLHVNMCSKGTFFLSKYTHSHHFDSFL